MLNLRAENFSEVSSRLFFVFASMFECVCWCVCVCACLSVCVVVCSVEVGNIGMMPVESTS